MLMSALKYHHPLLLNQLSCGRESKLSTFYSDLIERPKSMLIQFCRKRIILKKVSICVKTMDGLSSRTQNLFAVIYANLPWEMVLKRVYFIRLSVTIHQKWLLLACWGFQNSHRGGFHITECLLELEMLHLVKILFKKRVNWSNKVMKTLTDWSTYSIKENSNLKLDVMQTRPLKLVLMEH